MFSRLKLGNDFKYVLNSEGSTPAEVLGIDYKATLKPTLTALADEAKKTSMAKLEELISLQQQSRENAAKHEAKKTHLAALQSRFEEVKSSSYHHLLVSFEQHAGLKNEATVYSLCIFYLPLCVYPFLSSSHLLYFIFFLLEISLYMDLCKIQIGPHSFYLVNNGVT